MSESAAAAAHASTSSPSSRTSRTGAPKKSRGGGLDMWGRSSEGRNCPPDRPVLHRRTPPEEPATKVGGRHASSDERVAASRSTRDVASGGERHLLAHPPALRSFPPRWGTQCVMQAMRGGVMHRSGDNIPGTGDGTETGRRGEQRERCLAQGRSGLVRALQLRTRPVEMRTHFFPGTSPEAAMAAGEVTPLPPRTLLQVPTHCLKGVAEFPAPLTSDPKRKTLRVSLQWAGAGARSSILTFRTVHISKLLHRPAGAQTQGEGG